jgi:hypothetical protein
MVFFNEHMPMLLFNAGKFVASHEGFALRMPPSDVARWQMTNDKGELVDIPRPALALRVCTINTNLLPPLPISPLGANCSRSLF